MAIAHIIVINDKGDRVTFNLTPLKAIRKFCRECMDFQIYEIEKCTSKMCPLYPYRMGKIKAYNKFKEN